MVRFAHLHVHTDASLKDGFGPVSRLVNYAREIGYDALAMTDHGTLANAVSFSLECKANGIKPILGLEAYLNFGGYNGHITLLADGDRGWENIVKLNNLGHASTFKAPAITVEQLMEHSADVLCLTGCQASPFHRFDEPTALDLGRRLKLAFGDRLFAEVMFVSDVDTWSRSVWLSKQLRLPIVLTNDSHFPKKADAKLHPLLTKMKAGFEYNSSELWLKKPEEMRHRVMSFGRIPGDVVDKWMNNAFRIAERIRPVDLAKAQTLPVIEDASEKLYALAADGLRALEGRREYPAYRERMLYELRVIEEMGYCAYFLIVNDLVSTARKMGIEVGAGRGSGAGSLVLYLIGVTRVDPIVNNLSFERFLNPERRGMPDVDLDFESERRDQILQYAREKYHAIPIATYSRYNHKSMVHDLAKMFHADKELEIQAAELGPDSDAFRELCENYEDFEQAYSSMLNQIRHKGKHAGGVIITDNLVPIERAGDQLVAAWTEGSNNELSYAGIVKFDLLGLSALSVIRRMKELVGLTSDQYEKMLADPAVFEIFQSGDLAGIFQFSGSPGIRKLTMDLKPDKFDDLVAINALFRPGALDAGTAMEYPAFKKSPRKVPTLFADILAETYGVVVYQEQFMRMIQVALGGTLGQADLARRVITKGGKKTDDPKHLAELEALRSAFVGGCVERGMTEKEAVEWWGELETHGRYSFNKSHSTAYSMIAWEMACWKKFYPAEFYAQSMNVDSDQAQTFIATALDQGIPVRLPHVNFSGTEWTAHDGQLFMPLSSIKFMGMAGAETIVANRARLASKKYESIREFMNLNPKKLVRGRGREGLWYLGGFDGVDGVYADLDLSKKKLEETKTAVEAMRQYLGVIIPPSKTQAMMKSLREKGWVCGIIESVVHKTSRYGAYNVYHLSPSGMFWIREDEQSLQEGWIVGADVTSTNKAKAVEKLLL